MYTKNLPIDFDRLFVFFSCSLQLWKCVLSVQFWIQSLSMWSSLKNEALSGAQHKLITVLLGLLAWAQSLGSTAPGRKQKSGVSLWIHRLVGVFLCCLKTYFIIFTVVFFPLSCLEGKALGASNWHWGSWQEPWRNARLMKVFANLGSEERNCKAEF